MTTEQRGIITLLKSAITGEKLLLPDDFDLSASYALIQKHHMPTLIYDGAIRCGIDRNSEVMRKLFQDYVRTLRISESQMAQINRIFAAFDENNIDYLPLKGCKMKALYPKPELRVMGDADVLIRMEQYKRIIPIMESLGMTVACESDHELAWRNKSLYLELHKKLIPSHNRDFFSELGDGWQISKLYKGTQYQMSIEDEFVFLFTHFSKHYRSGGVGCRYIVDLWVYLRSNPEMNEEKIKRKLSKMNLLEFYVNIRRLITVWFENLDTDEKTDYISTFIFNSGSWGETESRVLRSAIGESKAFYKGKLGERVTYILRHIFPTFEAMRGMYPILIKKPWLLPFTWIVRMLRKVFVEKDSVSQQIRYISTLNPENIKTEQQALNYVGLDYNF